jgi:methionine synthase II (cobalamin-independent)
MANPFRVDPLGGLIKPQALLDAEAAQAAGTLDARGLADVQDAAIQQALLWQKELAVPVLTDGEMRRRAADAPYVAAIEGLQRRNGASAASWQSSYAVGGEIQQQQRLTRQEAGFLRAKTRAHVKVSLFAPSALALRMFEPGTTERHYPTLRALATAFSEIIRSEVLALVGEGVSYVQLSCPAYAWLYHPEARARLSLPPSLVASAFDELWDVDLQMLKRIERPDTVALGLQIPRCELIDPASDGFERLLEKVLPIAPVDRFLIEYADAQPHDFTALAALPTGKIAALGLVSTDREPEDVTDLVARVDQAATHIGERSLAVSMRRAPSNQSNLATEAALSRQRRAFERTMDTAMQLWGLEL